MSDSVARNRESWSAKAEEYAVAGASLWRTDAVSWGEYGVPEATLGVLPDVAGRDVVELGCGTGYVGAWLHRRGARSVIGVDPTENQLRSAQGFMAEVGPTFPLVQASGEQVPLRDGAFDVAVSEYGAALWADPARWLAEAARLLRSGGELVFLTNSVLFTLCAPDSEDPAGPTLVRPQWGLWAVEYDDDVAVEFHVSHGDMIRLLRGAGFEVLDLVELYAPAGAPDRRYISSEWAQQWPFEEVWRARRT